MTSGKSPTISSAWSATFFGMALYLLVGANLPYLPVWLEEGRGFSGAQISGMVSAAMLIRILVGPLIAARTEQVGLGKVLAQVALICLLAFGALLPQENPVYAVFVLVIITHIAWGAMMPLAEAVLLSGTKDKRPDYGMARALCSASFILASLSVGALVQAHGPEAALWWMVAASAVLVAMAVCLPAQSQPTLARPSLRAALREGAQLYRNRRILLAGLGASLIQAGHTYYYNLGSNIWLGQGIGEEHIGALWSTGVGVEVVFLLASGVLFARWTPGALILLGGLGAVLRWTATGFAPPIDLLYGLQALHALSFAATHIGLMRFFVEELPAEKVPVALAISSAVFYGPLYALLGVSTGYYYDHFPAAQAQGYWLMAVTCGLGVLCVLGLLRRVQPQSADIGGETKPSL